MRTAAAIVSVILLLGCREERPVARSVTKPAQSSTAIPEDSWYATGITANRAPQRLLIRKTGWRGGPEALIVESSEREAARLHHLLAGNQRIEWMCGYHWAVEFEYADGALESIDINEQCESFRHDSDEIWRILRSYFKRASEHPSHYLIRVVARDRSSKPALARDLEAHFGLVFNVDPRGTTLFVASRNPWSPERADEVRRSSALIAKVTEIETYDTGS